MFGQQYKRSSSSSCYSKSDSLYSISNLSDSSRISVGSNLYRNCNINIQQTNGLEEIEETIPGSKGDPFCAESSDGFISTDELDSLALSNNEEKSYHEGASNIEDLMNTSSSSRFEN